MLVGGPTGIKIENHLVRAGELVVASGTAPTVAGSSSGSAPHGPLALDPVSSLLSSRLGKDLVGVLATTCVLLGLCGIAAVAAFGWSPLLCVVPGAVALGGLGAFGARRFLLLPLVNQSLERRLLDAAAEHGGSLTTMQAARALRLPVREADAALGDLTRSGHVRADLDETEAVVRYRFAGLDEPPRLDKP